MRSESAMLSIGLASLVASAAAHGQVSFRGLGVFPPEMRTQVAAISPDGSVPAGRATGDYGNGFYTVKAVWWPDGIEELVGDAPFFDGGAFGVSDLGRVVIGHGQLGLGGPGTVHRAFRSVGSDFEFLPGFGEAVDTYAEAVTPDGNIIVGSSEGVPCQWNGNDAPSPLALPEGARSARAVGVSSDARRILGTYWVGNDLGLTLWTDGVPRVIPLSDRPLLTLDAAMSLDGETVVGTFVERGVGVRRSFSWTAAGGMMEIPDASTIFAVSADGSVVGGAGRNPNDFAALWINGERIDVEVLLTSMGMDLTGWDLSSVTAISADGLTIAGNGVHRFGDGPSDFRSEGWIAVIPGPSSGLMIGAGLLAVRRRRR